MEEVLGGVFHWRAVHPQINVEVDCHFLAASQTAIDPLLPAEGIGWFDDHGVSQVVLSNRHHLRHATQLAERFDCKILCHESGLYEFEATPAVKGFAFGDRLSAEVTALQMAAICPDDTVLRIDAADGALLFADSIVRHEEIGFVSDRLIGDEAESVKAEVRERCAALLDQPFENLLFAHGRPLLKVGRRAISSFLQS